MSTALTVKNVKGTRTELNIINAYMSEAQAVMRYTFYAKQAEKEGYFPLQAVFMETADNEMHHGKVFLKMVQGGEVHCTLPVDAVAVKDTITNLEISIHEEGDEAVKSYTAAAKVAEEEGFPEIATHFTTLAEVEQRHMERFRRYLERIKAGTLWKREQPITWRCLVCGYEHVGTEPPRVCPACDHPYQHYMPMDMD
jgi:rubrerythrin